MSPPANVASFDARPLTEPVDRAAVRAFARELRVSGRVPGVFPTSIIAIVLMCVFGVVILFVFATVGMSVLSAFADMEMRAGSSWVFVPAILPVLLIAGFVTLFIVLTVRGLGSSAVRWYRLDRFARANGMSYLPHLPNPALPGMIFSLGGDRTARDLVRGDRPRFVEFANYTYETGSGKERTTHRWGYVAVRLDVPLPNIVLDAKSNNGLFGASNLPASFDRHQRLSLEGDFGRHFSLYCPRGYERDALYLFTPDIMARFVDSAAALDVEIVDDWLFLYGRRDFSTLDPATWAWLFSVVGALLDKFAQWSRWRDERLADAARTASTAPAGTGMPGAPAASALPFAAPAGAPASPPGVAAPGRRLRRRVSWGAFVAVGGILLFWLLIQSGVLRGLFSVLLN